MIANRGSAVALIALGLVGCASSPPTRFLTLTSYSPVVTQETPTAIPIAVGVVTVPVVLDRLAVVTEGADTVLKVDDFARWGAPLGDLARRALIEDLAARRGAQTVVFPNSPAPAGAWLVTVNILALQRGEGGYAMTANWTASKRIGGTQNYEVRSHSLRLATAQAESGSRGEAEALSQLLGELADHISESLGSSAGSVSQ